MPTMVIVDDESIFRKGITHLVKGFDLDWEVVGEARDGLEALEQVQRLRPDLVITDIRMPRMDGLELQSALAEKAPDTKCIVLSGYNDFKYVQTSIRTGVRDYLLKPINKDELYQTLERMLDEWQQSRQLPLPAILHEQGRDHVTHAVDKVVAYIEAHYAEPVTLSMMADMVYLNASYLSSLFKARLGCSFVEVLTRRRIREACRRLVHTSEKIVLIAERTGFANLRHFNRVFKTETGRTPKQFREEMQKQSMV
ncbi:response regulator transcription factor [Paenibacillus medicaginis]|uniref:Response regulator n=1 Tax=Paenibacillus medicaginis TaxID=1470560 RepID=A0ABV5C1W6_9BACL